MRRSSSISANCCRNHRSIFVSSWIVSTVQPRRSARKIPHIRRSDGTSSRWDDCYGPTAWIHEGGMVVVDFKDDFDALAERDTQARIREYRERGWNVVE